MHQNFHTKHATEVEQSVAAHLKRKYGWRAVLAEPFECFDLLLYRGGASEVLHAIAEVKERRMNWGQYPTIHVSRSKMMRCAIEAKKLNALFFFVVKVTGGHVFMVRLNGERLNGLRVERSGRWDRGGVQNDVEEMVHIPIQYFEEVA